MTESASNRAKAALAEKRWTYGDMARELGISSQSVFDIVRGKTTRGTSRYAFAKALGLEVEDLWPEGEAEVAA